MFSLQSWLSRSVESKAVNSEAGPAADSEMPSRFAAMAKLVDEREFVALGRQAGFDARLLRKLRLERRRVYRLYLSEMVAEFRSFESEALDRAANDPGVDPGFAEEVLKVKARFTVSVWLLRMSLFLPAFSLPTTHQWTLDLVGAVRTQLSKAS